MTAAAAGRFDVAREQADAARRLAVRLEDDRLVAEADVVSAWVGLAEGTVFPALERLDGAWTSGDEQDDAVVAPMAARAAGWAHIFVLDLPGARVRLMREIGKTRARPASVERRLLGDTLALVGAMSGRIGEAVRLAETAKLDRKDSSAWPLIAYCQGEFADADALWTSQRERALATGWLTPWPSISLHARLLRSTDRIRDAADLLAPALDDVFGTGCVPGELTLRSDLALTQALLGETDEAKRHLSRCDEIAAGTTDWRGLGARLELARAVYHGSMGITGAAVRGFERAAEGFNRHASPWDEAEAHMLWGRSLLSHGRNDGAAELGIAVRIYEEYGAGRPLRDLVRVTA